MKRIIWMPRAIDELASIHEFISRDNPVYARVVIRRIIKATDRLDIFAGSGRMVPESKNPSIREIFVHSYRVMYRVLEDEVQILTVHHGAMPLEREGKE